jgi:hypothetical protein
MLAGTVFEITVDEEPLLQADKISKAERMPARDMPELNLIMNPSTWRMKRVCLENSQCRGWVFFRQPVRPLSLESEPGVAT